MKYIYLSGLIFLLGAYLFPLHLPPFNTFFNDFAWATSLVLLVATLIWRANNQYSVVIKSLGALSLLVMLALVAILWWFPGETAHFWGIYAGLAALTFSVGLGTRQQPDLLRVVLSALLLAALVSAVLAVLQWLGVFASGGWNPGFVLGASGGGRVHSNIGQANNLGTLLLLGMWALLVLAVEWRRTRIGAAMVILGLGILALGVYFSGSRTALLNLALAPVLVAVWSRWRNQPFDVWTAVPVGMVLVLNLLGPWLTAWWGAADAPETRSFADPVRLRLWQLAWDGILQSPWTGHGLEQLGRVYLELSPQYGSFNGTIPMHAHNTVLDLWLAFGLPLGSVMVLGVLGLWWRAAWRAQNGRDALLWLMPTAMLLHAMLEYPLHYGFFLWPFFLLLGVLNAPRVQAPSQTEEERLVSSETRVTRWRYALAGAWLSVGLGALFFVWKGYVETEALYTQARNRGLTVDELRAQTHPWSQALFPNLLTRLEWTIRPVDGQLTAAELESLTQTARQKPFPQLMWKVAVVNAYQGRPEVSAWWLGRACIMFPNQCKSMEEAWMLLSENSQLSDMPWDKWKTHKL